MRVAALTVFSLLSAAACSASSERQSMSGSAQESAQGPVKAEDWAKAEALALPYLKAEKHAVDPISFSRFEATPFLLGAWWTGGEAHVLIHGGKIHPERGVAALPGLFASLGPARLRAIDVDLLDGALLALGASQPTAPGTGGMLRRVDHDQDLFPKVVEANGVITYVVHCFEVRPPNPPGLTGGGPPPPAGGPPPPSGGPPPPSGGGRIITGTQVLQRWTLQLHPVPAQLDWKLEGRVERPVPPAKP